MTDAPVKDSVLYSPPTKTERWHRAKKITGLALSVLGGIFVVWLVWPGLTSTPSLSPDYLAMVAGLFIAFVALGFLAVVIWNERLTRIEHGRITLPFPIKKQRGTRTRYVHLEEIAEVELTVNSNVRRGAELTLLDGTRLFLPQTAFGDGGQKILEKLAHYVKGRSSGNSSRVSSRAHAD